MKLTIKCISPFSMIFRNPLNILFLQDRMEMIDCSFLQYQSLKQTHEKSNSIIYSSLPSN